MQAKPAIASEVGINPDNILLPYHNIFAGARYLKKMLEKFDGPYVLLITMPAGSLRYSEVSVQN
jgi:soluble lytic murein transglycosylase-like protein